MNIVKRIKRLLVVVAHQNDLNSLVFFCIQFSTISNEYQIDQITNIEIVHICCSALRIENEPKQQNKIILR